MIWAIRPGLTLHQDNGMVYIGGTAKTTSGVVSMEIELTPDEAEALRHGLAMIHQGRLLKGTADPNNEIDEEVGP